MPLERAVGPGHAAPQAAAVHIAHTRALSRTSVLLRDARFQVQGDIDQHPAAGPAAELAADGTPEGIAGRVRRRAGGQRAWLAAGLAAPVV
jgi:hypothetical protein